LNTFLLTNLNNFFMFIGCLSLFDFASADGATITGSWLTIASITMLLMTFLQDKIPNVSSFRKLLAIFFGMSIVSILLFIFDFKILGACTIIIELLFSFLYIPFFLLNINYSPSRFQNEDMKPEDLFPN